MRLVECLYSSVVEHCTCNAKVSGSSPDGGFKRQHVRVVKEVDLKSTGLSPRRFKSCCCRQGELAQVVERALCMREVVGSMPTFSNKLWFMFIPTFTHTDYIKICSQEPTNTKENSISSHI